MGLVAVETFRESGGALLVATARGGNGVAASSPPPFAFQRAADGRFIARLCDGASSVRVVVEPARVHVEWIGALEAIVVRQGEVLHRTAPHVFWTVKPTLAADLAGPWPTEPGDLVLLCSAKVHHVLSEADVTALASRDDLATIVRGLVTTTSTRGDFAELCAIAIRIEH